MMKTRLCSLIFLFLKTGWKQNLYVNLKYLKELVQYGVALYGKF